MSIAIPPRLAAKAGPVGPGAGVLLTEFPLSVYGRVSPQKRMQKAWALSFEVPWIAAAEDAITERFSGVDWHLEDENDETIDDTYTSPDAQAARTLIEKPSQNVSIGAPYYRSDLWALTARAMGICGSGFIFLDQPEAMAGTPSAMVPIAPWRMYPDDDEQGNLTGWHIDKSQNNPGIEVSLDQILHFQLRRNFVGHFGVGLMESAMRKLQISQGLDDHMNMVISAGGRLSGVMSPSQGVMDADVMLQMERDWRTIVEQSDAARRLQLVRAPIKFDRTTLTPQELQIVDLLKNAKEELLSIWGVPLSIIGGSTPAGLNSGDTRKYDEAAIWQGPVHHRLNVFRETIQYQLLDRYQARGATVELEIEEPEFDDDSPRYDLLGKSLNTPLRNVERRALIGLPPFGDPEMDNAVLLPSTLVPYISAPDEANEATVTAVVLGRAPEQISSGTPAMLAAGEQGAPANPAGKAVLPSRLGRRVAPLHASLVRYREHAQASFTPLLKSSVGDVLRAQKQDIVARLRKHADHLALHPTDTSIWFDKGWDAKLHKALAPRLEAIANVVNAQIHDVLPAKAAPVGAVERVMTRGAARVTGINQTTREKVQTAITRGLEQGLSVLDVADLIEGIGSEDIGLDLPSLFDEYRAEMIARTELMDAYNASAIASYGDAGITQVQAIDGDGDEECAARDGQTFDIEEADTIEDHPNGTLDWVPVMDEAKAMMAPIINVNFAEGAFRAGDVHLPAMAAMPAPVVNVSVPDQAPPVVNVTHAAIPAPVVNVTHPVVNVAAPVVNVAAPDVTPTMVMMPPEKRITVLDRDNRTGLVTGSHEV